MQGNNTAFTSVVPEMCEIQDVISWTPVLTWSVASLPSPPLWLLLHNAVSQSSPRNTMAHHNVSSKILKCILKALPVTQDLMLH